MSTTQDPNNTPTAIASELNARPGCLAAGMLAVLLVLAAIYVPCFMDAQERSKVSRVRSDMRSVSTAIQAYMIDHQAPPYSGEPGQKPHGWVRSYAQLTTPISYLRFIFRDPYDAEDLSKHKRAEVLFGRGAQPGRADVWVFLYAAAYQEIGNDPKKAPLLVTYPASHEPFRLASPGPDRAYLKPGSNFGLAEMYDPTNGETSAGDIVWPPPR